jgi:hypothetical protein
MTPFRAIGANATVRDAALLRDVLRDVDNGRQAAVARGPSKRSAPSMSSSTTPASPSTTI